MNLPPRIRLALADLRRQREEPLCAYLYDLPALAERVRAMRAALPPACELFYAAKANPEEAILRTLAPLVDGFEAASGGELAWLRQHCPEHPLIFGGPGKLESELDAALLANLDAFHVESLHELRRLASLARRRERRIPLLLRLNLKLDETPDSRLVMGGKPTPFGLDEEALDEALALLREEPALELKGLHFHLLSHQLDVSAHLQLVRAYCRAFLRIAGESGLPLSLLNVGGGMGIDYRDFARSFDWSGFCDALPALLDEEGMGGIRLRFEVGRYIAAPCGYYAMEVLDIKRNHGELFAVARGGTHHFRTPAAQGHDHPFVVVRGERAAEIEDQAVTLVGQLCTPKDVLARRQPVAALAVGDLLVFTLAGAYAWNISHRDFLMHEPPRMLFLQD
ncbi:MULTISPECIES: type III PLP-dependent enzyme [Pseudomonas aeruginosa group]|uniref:type III PLP-dependent enzyme n=1 Tax=Pseudomonas aeruginosa group TaxID=136841 RepID=UPI0006B29DF5|nr:MULTISPECIES: type III PLP-dependent enzyme [Pseudomonas aeruginosa group]KPD26581.1 diaminopimelate decarboxylase [Pseudomonas paraeruginosa]KQB29166.1 diaminopimelate decarboxylase [Pseudomonas paraeruginosa]MDT1024569.1 type III PLP-dependent enzyme [Pseudomonas paraeruginosa]PHJ29842.1 siderophore biosynthesis PLP-dependent protein [Pseudomonas paraeruginosa]QQV51503.1 type III PLP-dependent enzyme [Pseudomonas aeruginosa]